VGNRDIRVAECHFPSKATLTHPPELRLSAESDTLASTSRRWHAPIVSNHDARQREAADGVREFRERLVAERSVVAKVDGRRRDLFPVAIGPEEGEALLAWVRRERAHRSLEAGLGFGISTLFICEGLLTNGGDGHHVAADPFQHVGLPTHSTSYAGVGLQLLEEAGVRHLVEFYPEESQTVFPRLLAQGRQFDLAFLDGNHRFEAVFLDLIYAGRLLPEGRVIFVDDVQIPGPKHAVQFCVANLGWVIEDEGREGGHEWAVIRTASHDAFLRPYTDFVAFWDVAS
jgi:predicted O-methyltransferase YrrM